MSQADEAVQQRVEVLRLGYEQKLPVQMERIETLWNKLQFVKWEQEAFRLLFRLVHNLHGTAGSLGFYEVSERSEQLAELLRASADCETPPTQQERDRITAVLQRLVSLGKSSRTDGSRAAGTDAGETGRPPAARGMVYVLDDDCELSELIRLHLEHQGFSVQCFATTDAFVAAVHERPPSAIIADVVFPEGPLRGIQFIAELRHELVSLPPVLFVSARADLEARIAAIRAGGQAYFTKPLDLDGLAKRLDKLVATSQGHGYRALVVEDDKEQAAYFALVLQQAGIGAQVVVNPSQLLEKMEAFRPDLVLMDMHLPSCTGPELARMIRQDPRYEELPVVFMSAHADLDEELAVLREGGDGFLKKPVDPQHLVAVVAGRVRRAREIAQRIQFLNKKDLVTGLYNRPYFMRALDRAQAQVSHTGARYGMLYLELDDFHGVRERVGLAAADLLMADVAGVLSQHLEPGDIAARFGDASCALLLPDRSEDELLESAAALAKVIAKPVYQIGGKSLVVTVSIGAVVLIDPAATADQVVNRAAIACETARTRGTGEIELVRIVPQDQGVDGVDHSECLKQLQEALRQEGFYLVFQPIASLRGDRKERYEILLRMRARDGSEVLPARFLPVAREADLLEAIDRWVLDHALHMLAERSADGRPTLLFIKVSEASISSPKFVHWLGDRIRRYGVKGGELVLELPEEAIVDNLNDATAFVGQVRKMGCAIALEHFGTHLNAAQLLQHLEADFVKLDGSFMHQLGDNPANQSTLRDLVANAADQGAVIIAGFVEDAASLNVLWQTGVQFIQGNFLQEPDDMLAFDFSELLA